MTPENENEREKWCRMLVKERSKCFSDFISSKRSEIFSEILQVKEQAITDIYNVISFLPDDFLQSEDVTLLMNFFFSLLDSSPFATDVIIQALNHLVIKSKNLPENFEAVLIRVLFQDGNLQSWAQKERDLQYEILIWLLRNRTEVLKGMGADFLNTFIKSVSGERDPRCLVQMFRAFLEVTTHFSLGPFTEDMFETIACYFPIEFRQQTSDSISREYLAASCSSCLVSSKSFAPFCFLFIDEKLNDEECSDDECKDVLELLISACDSFPSVSILDHIEPLLDGIRKVVFNPKSKGQLDTHASEAFRKIMDHCAKLSLNNKKTISRTIDNLLENSEPFVLQAEMGLSRKALNLLRCAFTCLTHQNSQTVLNQSIAWILNLVQGRSVNAAGNMADIIEEGLQYLVEWVQLAGKQTDTFRDSLINFEQSVFESCYTAREYKPQQSRIAMHECATVYLYVKCASDELILRSKSLFSTGLISVMENKELESFLKFVEVFSSFHFDAVKNVIFEHPVTTWNRCSILPILCAAARSSLSWDHLEMQIASAIKHEMSIAEDDVVLSSYLRMMKDCENNRTLFLRQLEVFDNALLTTDVKNPTIVAKVLQSITLLLTSNDHQMFMNKLTLRYKDMADEQMSDFDRKYLAAYLQNSNTDDIMSVAGKNLSPRTVQQLKFAACNRNPTKYGNKNDRLLELKAKLLRNNEDAIEIFDTFLLHLNGDATSNIVSFDYLLDFENFDTDPGRCRYVTASPLWRQRIFCQIVPVFKRMFDNFPEGRDALSQLLPFLLKFASPLNSSQMKQQFRMLLPVLIQAIRPEGRLSSHVTRSVPMFLTIAEPLEPEDLHLIAAYLCSVLKRTDSSFESLENSLNSFNILAQRQPSRALHSEIGIVVPSIKKMLGHKKRMLRVMAAQVRNNWEMLASH